MSFALMIRSNGFRVFLLADGVPFTGEYKSGSKATGYKQQSAEAALSRISSQAQ
jgi:hypothetical protein